MEHLIVEALNRQTTLLNHLIKLVGKLETQISKLEKKKALEDAGWYNAERTMEILGYGEKTLYRMRKNHPEQCRRVLGVWLYNINVLDFNPKD